MSERAVCIRTCRPVDVEAVIEIMAEVFGPCAIEQKIETMLGPTEPSGWLGIKSRDVRRQMQRDPDGCFVAETDGRITGYVTTAVYRDLSRGAILNLAVPADAQGHGIGRMLLNRAVEHFRSLGLAQAKIETLAWNEAGRHLYPSVGFLEVASQVHYIMSLR